MKLYSSFFFDGPPITDPPGFKPLRLVGDATPAQRTAQIAQVGLELNNALPGEIVCANCEESQNNIIAAIRCGGIKPEDSKALYSAYVPSVFGDIYALTGNLVTTKSAADNRAAERRRVMSNVRKLDPWVDVWSLDLHVRQNFAWTNLGMNALGTHLTMTETLLSLIEGTGKPWIGWVNLIQHDNGYPQPPGTLADKLIVYQTLAWMKNHGAAGAAIMAWDQKKEGGKVPFSNEVSALLGTLGRDFGATT